MDETDLRRRAEQRLAGYVRLGQQAQKVVLYLVLYAILCLVIDRAPGWPFHYSIQYSPNSRGWYLIEFWNDVILAFGALFGLCLFSLLVGFAREQAIQRGIQREMDLELMRMQVQLEQAKAEPEHPGVDMDLQKPKRDLALSDDGELTSADEFQSARNHSAAKR